MNVRNGKTLNYVGTTRFGIGGVSGHWSARDILAHIMALSEEQLNEHNLAERLAKATYKHYQQHAADIRTRFKTPLKH